MLKDLHEKNVAILGKIPGWNQTDLEILLRARGAWRVQSSASKYIHIAISAETEGPKVDKARSLGIPIVEAAVLRSALGEPLADYRTRLERRLAAQPRYMKNAVLALGGPASGEALSRVEERIGFSLPTAARNLFSQLDGLSLLWTIPSLQPSSGDPIPWSDACGDGSELWSRLRALRKAQPKRFGMGLACIPPLETVFFNKWEGCMFSGEDYDAKATLQLGKRKLNAREFFANLFIFDAFSPYYLAGLYADRAAGELFVAYGSDYGADWSFAHLVPFEVYMEFLLVQLGRTRAIVPSSKLGWPTSFARIAGQSWIELNPYQA